MRGIATVALLAVLAAAVGCGKGGEATTGVEADKPPFSLINLDILTNDYRDNPATADAKYKARVGKVPLSGPVMDRRGQDTVAIWKPPTMLRKAERASVVFRFTSETEAAKVERGKLYTVEGVCQGLVGDEVVFTRSRVLADGFKPDDK